MTRWRTELELRDAIDHDQLVLYYQPIMARDGSLAGLEALVRWQHPTRACWRPTHLF